jgi:hypothetical protein
MLLHDFKKVFLLPKIHYNLIKKNYNQYLAGNSCQTKVIKTNEGDEALRNSRTFLLDQ